MRTMQPTRGILSTGLMATLGAIILNVVFLYLAWNVFDIHPQVNMGANGELIQLGMVRVVLVTLIPGLVATLLYWVLVRFTPWPNIIFGTVSFIILVVSFFGPFMLEIPGYEQLVLVMFHVLAAIAIAPTLMIAGLFTEDDCCDDCGMEEFCDDENCEECIIICDECGAEDCEEHMDDIMIDSCGCGCEGACECGEDYDCTEDCECADHCECEEECTCGGEKECCGEGCCRDSKDEQ